MSRPAWAIRRLGLDDQAAWRPLWRAYQAFYQVALGEAVEAHTWARLSGGESPLFALGAFGPDGALVGIAHAVPHESTWTLAEELYLQDLYTLPECRGQGVGRALIEALYAEARALGAPRVHWLTHESNAAGQALYDRVADRPGFVEYERHLKA